MAQKQPALCWGPDFSKDVFDKEYLACVSASGNHLLNDWQS